jgi:hypothetical protein
VLDNICFLLVFRDALFKQVLSNLLVEMNSRFEVFESNSEIVDDLLIEISKLQPDTVLLEETSPLSGNSCLFHLVKEMRGRPIIVVSQEYNLMHIVNWRTVPVETVNDLIKSIKSG